MSRARATTLPTLVHDPARVPDGARIRRITSSIEGAREGRGITAVVEEVWYAIVTVGLSVAFVAGVAAAIHEAAPDDPATASLSGELPAALVVLSGVGALLSLAGRLGPVGVGGGGSAWWLPLPVARRGLLRPTVLAWPLISAAAGAVLVPLVVFTLEGAPTLAIALQWSAFGGALTGFLAAAAVWTQGSVDPRRTALVGEVLMTVGAALIALLALLPSTWVATARAWSLGGAWWGWLPLAAAAVVLTVLAERHADRLDGAGLRAHGAVGSRAQIAVLSLDLRELSRALATGTLRARRRSWDLRAGGPRRALVVADAVLALRTPRLLAQTTMTTLLVVALSRVPLLASGLALYGTLLVLGFWTTNASAAGARHADLVPALDRVVPLSARWVRVTRAAVPALFGVVWTVVALGTLAVRADEPLWWAMVPSWAAVLAAAAVRSAYRPPPRWAKAVVSSPMGAMPPTGGLFHGLDVALVGTLPTAVALFVGVLNPVLVGIQSLMAAALVATLVARSGRPEGARV